jgi:enoyl-[acyl-carrier protein] reductase I
MEKKAPLRRNVTGKEVGDSAAFLLSEHGSGITGQTIHVDCGYSSIGL